MESVQAETTAGHLCVCSVHSSTFEHSVPVPEYPATQRQAYDPTLFTQAALAWQLWLLLVHSFTSEHTLPLPLYPELQEQAKEPTLFVQVALLWQGNRPEEHSLMSVH
jgi:hypothetical protein